MAGKLPYSDIPREVKRARAFHAEKYAVFLGYPAVSFVVCRYETYPCYFMTTTDLHYD